MPVTYHSKICEIAHGAMANLFASGLIDAHRMMEFDRLCVNPDAAPDSHTALVPPPAAPQPLQIDKAAAPKAVVAPQLAAPPPSLPAPAVSPSLPAAPLPSPTLATPAQQAEKIAMSLQTAAALRALREREGVNVAVFAHHLDVQPQTVLAWEAGFLRPTATVARLLEIVAEKGLRAIQ